MDGVSLTTNAQKPATRETIDWRPDTLWINIEEAHFRNLLNDSEVFEV